MRTLISIYLKLQLISSKNFSLQFLAFHFHKHRHLLSISSCHLGGSRGGRDADVWSGVEAVHLVCKERVWYSDVPSLGFGPFGGLVLSTTIIRVLELLHLVSR